MTKILITGVIGWLLSRFHFDSRSTLDEISELAVVCFIVQSEDRTNSGP